MRGLDRQQHEVVLRKLDRLLRCTPGLEEGRPDGQETAAIHRRVQSARGARSAQRRPHDSGDRRRSRGASQPSPTGSGKPSTACTTCSPPAPSAGRTITKRSSMAPGSLMQSAHLFGLHQSRSVTGSRVVRQSGSRPKRYGSEDRTAGSGAGRPGAAVDRLGGRCRMTTRCRAPVALRPTKPRRQHDGRHDRLDGPTPSRGLLPWRGGLRTSEVPVHKTGTTPGAGRAAPVIGDHTKCTD